MDGPLMPTTILGAVFGLMLISLVPIGIVALLRSKRVGTPNLISGEP
jgi:hypothetical protein